MLLGTLIAKLEDEACATDFIAVLGDLVLYAEIVAAAERFDETPGAYLAASVGEFAAAAADEEWVSLIATVERAEDPGRAAIQRIVRWAMAHESAGAMGAGQSCGCAS